MKKVYLSAQTELCIPFYDADMMHIVWHGNYIKYFEDARCALLDKLGFNYIEMSKTEFIWPIIDIRVKFVKPARFQDKVRISANLVEFQNCLKIEYCIESLRDGSILTRGYTVQAAVNRESNEMQFTSPQVLIDKIAKFGIEV